MSDINNAPPMPRGQMPIEEVFRMMWARMNYLENALKDSKITTSEQNTEINQVSNFATPSNHAVSATPSESGQDVVFATKPITVDQLTNESNEPSQSSFQSNKPSSQNLISTPAPFKSQTTPYQNITLETNSIPNNNEVMETINTQQTKINEIWETLTQMKSQMTENQSTFNETIDNISTDLSEMNSKYTQMNNFLMEIQTTQITVNNQILRHYNENYSEMMESAIEKSASEKFASKDGDESNVVDGDESDEIEKVTTDSTINASTNEEQVATTEPENSKTMSFNIE